MTHFSRLSKVSLFEALKCKVEGKCLWGAVYVSLQLSLGRFEIKGLEISIVFHLLLYYVTYYIIYYRGFQLFPLYPRPFSHC